MTAGNAPTFHAVSTAVGSGKTRAAIAYIADPDHARQNFIYVAPTIRLIEQTATGIRLAIEEIGHGRDVALIHSESRQAEGMPVAVETATKINEAAPDEGLVVIITTTTFLRILSDIHTPKHWRVIIDEGFSPVEFLKVHLGARADEGLDHFLSVFAIDPDQDHRVIPAPGQAGWVDELAPGVVRRAGEKYATFQPLAAAVSNPAMRCELVMSPKTHAILARTYVAKNDDLLDGSRVAAESILLVASYVTPGPFAGFGEVIFMSALFEQTLLHQMWSTLFGVNFIEHPAFSKDVLRNIHVDQGQFVAVGHLLHPGDRSSKYNLERNRGTGAKYENEPGQRVIDQLVQLSSEYFQDSRFLLQTNNGYGYANGSSLMPSNAVKVPASSHGLNEFQDHDNVAALAVTNPNPQETQWIMEKTGLDRDQTNMAFRIHTTYQAVGRSSIRKADPTSDRKVFLTVGYTDALMLHEIFEGCLDSRLPSTCTRTTVTGSSLRGCVWTRWLPAAGTRASRALGQKRPNPNGGGSPVVETSSRTSSRPGSRSARSSGWTRRSPWRTSKSPSAYRRRRTSSTRTRSATSLKRRSRSR